MTTQLTLTPIQRLFRSRKFLILGADFVFSTVLYFVGKYAIPEVAADVEYLVIGLQVPVGMLIKAIADEDAAEKANGTHFSQRQ